MPRTERDRKSIGLTPEAQSILTDLEELAWFSEGQDIARFCMSYAIRAGVRDGATSATQTRWAAGNFDETGEIRSLLAALYPECETPVRLMEHLVNEGLRLVGERARQGAIAPGDLIG